MTLLPLVAVAALTACGGSGGDTAAQEHARAVAYAEMDMASYSKGDFAHVARAERIAPRLWHVELKWNGGKATWTCLTIQLDHFYIHDTSNGPSRGGVEARGGHCPG